MSEAQQDIQTLGGSRELRKILDDLRADDHISELVDGYRLCIATACAFQRVPDPTATYENRNTMFAPTTLDTGDFAIRTAIAEIYPEFGATPYRAAQDLAEQGARILKRFLVGDQLSFTDLLERVERASQGNEPS